MKFVKYIIIIIAFIAMGAKEAKAQVDTVFWFAAPWVTPDHDDRDPINFHFATFANPTTVRIYQPASIYDTTINIGANTLFSHYIAHIMDSLESKPTNQVLNSGFKIQADYPITVVYDVVTRPPASNNPETYSLKGQNGMGKEFVLPFQTLWNNQTLGSDRNGDGIVTQPYQQFNVVATEDSTIIYITPRCPIVGHPANVTFSVLLPKKGQSWTGQNVTQITNVLGSNLSGTVVVADKAISVTVSDDSVNPSGGGGCYDLMGDQIVPVDVIGKEYIVNIGFLNAGSNESAFIVATENFTTVSINNGITTTTTTLNQGDTYQYSITEPLTYINTGKPVYVWHMSGYGCEMGEAILPPLNCAGSDQVAFSRSTTVSFLLDILCPSGAEGNFTLNGSTTLVTAPMFSVVPGTGGAWLGAQISFTLAEIPVGTANLLTNSSDLFSMGVINGSATGGCLYHYMSSFIRRVFTDAGSDTTLCNGEPIINLNGSVTGGATTGIWTVLNGTGTVATPTNLSTNYAPTASDYAQGTLTFVLASTGNCEPVSDTIVVDFIASPAVTAGGDDTFCKNNVGSIPISGSLQFAAGSNWSGGTGGAFGNVGDLNTTYTPSPADLAADSVELYITSAGSFFACPNDEDTVVIYFTDAPVVVAGPDEVVCSSTPFITLGGSVTSTSTTGTWTSTGSGSFSPSQTDLNGDYNISSADTTAGSVTITLTSTNNGTCLAVTDSLTITILDKPVVSIITVDSICANAATINLDGFVTTGFSSNWTVLGSGGVANPTLIPTTYTISPIDTAAGYVDIILETTGGICPVEQDSIRLLFVAPPKVIAGIDQEFCENEPVQLTGLLSGTALSASWTSTGTGSFSPSSALLSTFYLPSALDVANGGVNLILTSSADFGCFADDDTLVVTFKAAPVADFSIDQACFGDNTNFLDLSTTTDGSINTWSYDFGDATGSIANNPLHNYPGAGSYTATLIAGSTNGCFDTVLKTVIVNPVPTAIFTPTSLCVGTTTQFNDASFISSGAIVAWDWDFNSGAGLSTDQDPLYAFGTAGSYPVILTVTSDLGCVGTLTSNVNVLPGPIADFSMAPNPALALEDVYFTDLSTNGPIVTWFWNFGDGIGGNNQNEVHDYANGGSYSVSLSVTDTNGCTDTIGKTLYVALLPVLPTAFTPNGSGDNDEFIIRGGPFEAVDFKIYSSWGQLIFESYDANVGWDGTFNNAPAQLGVYTWTFTVNMAGGRVVIKEGDVTLMR
ncbi:MAG: gliding motility-associated-like protein [Parvicellaceae bacterium]|jgi:gliding motility-associated-like protein